MGVHLRRRLGPVALLAVLSLTAVGCGDDDGGATDASDPSSSSASSSTSQSPSPSAPASSGAVDFQLVDMVTKTAAGGTVGSAAVLGDDAATAEFASQFQPDAMGTALQAAVSGTTVPDGMALYAAVVAIGCDSPTDVTVTGTGASLQVDAVAVPSPLPECLAPMTTVALLLLPADAVA